MKRKSTLTLLFLFINALCFAQWNASPTKNNAICNAAGSQTFSQAAPDGNGGAFVCWMDGRVGNPGDIYLQHLNSKGEKLLTANGKVLSAGQKAARPKITPDGSGGVFVAWIDYRNQTGTNNQEQDIYAQHVNANGVATWTAGGLALDSNPDIKAHISLVNDGKGGLYAAWDEFRYGNEVNILGQHLNSSGSALVSNTQYGLQLSYPNNYYAYEPQLVSDMAGGFIVTWYDDRSGYGDDIFAQHYDSSFNKKWGYEDLPICQQDYDQLYPRIISDGHKGAIIVWDDNRKGFGGATYDVYVQWVDSAGNKKWLAPTDPWYFNNGLPVCTATGRQFMPQLTGDSAGGAYITWADERGNFDMYAQRVRQDGSMAFATDGILLSTTQTYPGSAIFEEDEVTSCIMADKKGNAVIVCTDNRNGNNNLDIYGQKIDTAGNKLWNTNGVAICTAADNQQRAVIVPNGDGAGIVFWEDNRDYATSNSDIYSSLLTSTGTLPVTMLPLTASYIKSDVMLQWQTATELNNKYFAIERSTNSVTFDSIGMVAGVTHSATNLHYSYLDLSPAAESNYYRLKQVDEDGNYMYSNTVVVKAPGKTAVANVYPNPAARYITITMPGITIADNVTIYNMQGQAVKQWQHASVNNAFDVSQLAAGQYTVSIITNGTVTTNKIIIQR